MMIKLNQQEIGAISGSVNCRCLGITLAVVAVGYFLSYFVMRLDNIAGCRNWKKEGWKCKEGCERHLKRWNV